MDFRFSRRVSTLPGLKLNLSGSGVSLSAGVRGAHINLGPRGLYGSAGTPETGLSYRQCLDSCSRSYPDLYSHLLYIYTMDKGRRILKMDGFEVPSVFYLRPDVPIVLTSNSHECS
jgi:hypothetical protein